MESAETREKLEALHKLLSQDSTTLEKFQSAAKLAQGINSQIDAALDKAEDALGKIENLSKGEVIELSAEVLPEETEKQKKRKKAIILFIKHYKELKSEIERVKSEFEASKSNGQQLSTAGRIAAFAKGPLGIITIAAVIIVAVGGMLLSQTSTTNPPNQASQSASPSPTAEKIKGIIFNGQKIPLTELKTATGPECDQDSHYHAADHNSATAIDSSTVPDPGGCGFGKVKEVQIVEF